MTSIEEQFFKAFGIGKPVIKKWYYDGYYEDFSWQSEEVDCTELLKYFDNSIDKLNKRIQELKKDKEKNKYDVSTDSVSTEFGRMSGAYIDYPKITDRILLELYVLLYKEGIYGYSDWGGCYPVGDTVDEIKQSILSTCIEANSRIYEQVQALFKGEE